MSQICGGVKSPTGVGSFCSLQFDVSLFSWVNRAKTEIVKRIKDELLEKIDTGGDGTIVIGVNLSAGFGGGVGSSMGIGVDAKGNIGIVNSISAGATMPTASIVGFISITNAEKLDSLAGQAMIAGGSGGEIVVAGGELTIFTDNEMDNRTADIRYGFSVMAGLGVGTPVELHGEISQGYVSSINIYEILIDCCGYILCEEKIK